MAPTLALRVPPDEQWGEDLLASFYASVLGKRRRLAPEREWPDLPAMPGFVVGLEYLGERPFVEEPVPETIAAALDAAFEGGTLAGDALDEVADALRGAAAGADEETALDVACGPVALCEFAREKGYAVELTGQ